MRNCAQIGIDDEIFVDSFAGGGGASTGMEVGLGITVAAAINHDPASDPDAQDEPSVHGALSGVRLGC